MKPEEQEILERLSAADKMLLALVILDLRDSGPQHRRVIEASHSTSGGRLWLETLLATVHFTLPRPLARIFGWLESFKIRREKRRISRVLEIGVRANLVLSGEQCSSTPAAERWAEEVYAAAGSETYNNDACIVTLAVEICEALRTPDKLRTDDLRRECAPRLHPLLLQDPAQQRMHQGRTAAYHRAFDLALLFALREDWIENDENGDWKLTMRGRDTGLHYFDNIR